MNKARTGMRKVIILVVLILSLAFSQAFGMTCVTALDVPVTISPAETEAIMDLFRYRFPNRQIASVIYRLIDLGKAELIKPGTKVEVLEKGFGSAKNIWKIKIEDKEWFTFYRFLKCGEDT